jgi:hypothetical protein
MLSVRTPGGTTNVPDALKTHDPPETKPPKTPIFDEPIAIIFS